MGKLLPSDKPNHGVPKPDNPDDAPPQIPPRMKKKGPALPEKPPHMRAAPSSQPPVREPLRPRVLNLEKPPGQREVLVAACKAGRDRPVERRQREPAKLLKPTGGGPSSRDDTAFSGTVTKNELSVLPLRGHLRLEDCLPPKRDFASKGGTPLWLRDEGPPTRARFSATTGRRGGSNRPPQPVLLIPRNLLSSWGSAPLSYALWTTPGIKSLKHDPLRGPSDTPAVRARSGSVTRSGSLTSQGSSGSDSGGETFPKSVLKKQRRSSASHPPKGTPSNRRVDQKKNVTFNAFATVQLMEE